MLLFLLKDNRYNELEQVENCVQFFNLYKLEIKVVQTSEDYLKIKLNVYIGAYKTVPGTQYIVNKC